MKVLKKTIIITMSPFGNAVSDYYNSLADEFIKNNFKVIFIFDWLSDRTKLPYKNQGLNSHKKILFWPSKRPTKIKDFIFLYDIIKKEKPLICISNFGSTNVVSVVSYFLRVKNRINYIHTTSKQIDLDIKVNKIKKTFLKYRKRLVYKLCTKVFTNSNGTKKDTISFYKISEKKINIFPLLLNKSNINYKTQKERENCICIVGRLNHSKGHKELFLLFKIVIKKYPNLKLKIIGDGLLKEDLVKLAKFLKIDQNIIFVGKVQHFEVGKFLSKSLIGVSSSLEEAYGLVNIESLREGTPLVCTKTAGSLDILLPKYNGLYFSHSSNTSLLDAITDIFENWQYYSTNALNTFEKKYSYNNIENHFKLILDN